MTKEKISLNPVQKGLTNMAEIVNLLSRVLTSNPLVQSGAVAQTRSSSNPFAQNGGNPFVTSNPFANYGRISLLQAVILPDITIISLISSEDDSL